MASTTHADDSELCESLTPISYVAVAFPGSGGLLVATGEHPTAGFTVFFRAISAPGGSPLAPQVARYELRQQRPTGPVADVVTPFRAEIGLTGAAPGAKVIVVDAGPTVVTVASTDDRP